MDQHHHQPIQDDHNNPNLGTPYPFYQQEDETQYMAYSQQIPHYQAMHPAPPPRQLSTHDLQGGLQSMQFRGLTLMPQQPHYPGPVYSSPPQPMNMPLSASPPPQSPNMYDPLSPPVSGSDTSAEGIYGSRNSSGAGSPTSSRANSLVHRNPLRYNPTPSPSTSSGRRSRGHSLSDDDVMGGTNLAETLSGARKEATRKQRIEAEQRRRDELRDGYAKLKDVLPVSNQKSSKVSLLERATNHISVLEKQNRDLQSRVSAMESEIRRLRVLNEKISLTGPGDTPSPGQSMVMTPMDSRPLSPPPEGIHQLASIGGQTPPREDSDGSDNEGGY